MFPGTKYDKFKHPFESKKKKALFDYIKQYVRCLKDL